MDAANHDHGIAVELPCCAQTRALVGVIQYLRRAGRKTLLEWLTVLAFSVVFAVLAVAFGWLWRIDGVVYDMGLRFHQADPDQDILIVAIDDRSLSHFGRWPWDRRVHATLIESLTRLGARVIVFDVILHENSRQDPEADLLLAQAIADHGAVALPVTHANYAARGDGEGLPAQPFLMAAAALGHIQMEIDPDGIARSLYLWEGAGVPRYPQLALAALTLERPEQAALYSPERTFEPVHGWVRDSWMHIPFAGSPGTFRHLSYADVLAGEVDPDLIRNAVVFIGATAAGMGDMIPTPTSGYSSLMPGVEIHANVLSALRRGDLIEVQSRWVVAPVSAMWVTLLMLVMLRTRPRATLMAAFAFGGLGLASSWWLLIHWHVWIPPSAAIMATMLAFPLWSWRRLEASRRYFDVELEDLRKANAGLEVGASGRSKDSFLDHITVLREAARKQRDLHRSREETMHFLSHDIRAPLAGIVTLIDSAPCDDAGRTILSAEAAERISRQARSALSLADNLLRLVKAEGSDPLHFSETSLELLVQDAADEVWSLARQKQLKLLTEFTETSGQGECCVLGDADLLRRAVINLLTNAIKYTPSGGQVSLRLRRDAGHCVIEVEDTGEGISEAQQQLLFQRFSRLSTEANRKVSGIGLGLLMVRTVVDRHGGSIKVTSTPGQGSTFSLTLPACAVEAFDDLQVVNH